MLQKKLRTLTILLLFAVVTCYGQQKTVTGIIKDAEGKLLSAVSVQEKGSTNTTVSDDQGAFSMNVKTGATLVFTSIGFDKVEIKTGNRTSIDVQMAATSGDLGEAVVTALGVKKDKRSLGYATSTVKGEDLLKAGTTLNPFLALYGKAAGVGVNIGSSGPTGGVNVRIRGAAGLESGTNTRPLFVVDGVPLYDEKTSMESRGF